MVIELLRGRNKLVIAPPTSIALHKIITSPSHPPPNPNPTTAPTLRNLLGMYWELLDRKFKQTIAEVNLSAFAYRLFHEDFSSIVRANGAFVHKLSIEHSTT